MTKLKKIKNSPFWKVFIIIRNFILLFLYFLGTGILKIIKEEPNKNAIKPEKQEKTQPEIKNNYKISDFFKKKV